MKPKYKGDHRSGLEDKIAAWLDLRNIKYGFESIKLAYIGLSCPHCNETITNNIYTPDFIFERKKGRLIIESKGRFTVEDRKKMIKVKEQNPKEDIRFVFQYDSYLTKVGKTKEGKRKPKEETAKKPKYSDWCKKNGFQYHIFSLETPIPLSWLKEG